MNRHVRTATITATAALLLPSTIAHAASITDEESMLTPQAGWEVTPISTVGESYNGYTPPGILDGISVFQGQGKGKSKGRMTAYVNHELRTNVGYAYELANGTSLTGARISAYELQTKTLKVLRAELAYDTIFDVEGREVTDSDQINPVNEGENGIGRLCSARGIAAGEYGFVDEMHLAGEEQSNGVLFALDIDSEELWAVPDAGLLAWENVSPVDTGDSDTVALMVGDDHEGAPLWLYVGTKQPRGNFLERNGLSGGQLYAWVAEANDPAGTFDSPAEFSGNGSTAEGTWVAVDVRNGDGTLRTTEELDAAADAVGHFAFSRPEDVHDNPANAQQLVLSSTGRQTWDGGSDQYGTTYLVDAAFSAGQPTGATLNIVYDGDDALDQVGIDSMLRSPDNLTWASDGSIYVQEDRAISSSLWGTVDASIWRLDPSSTNPADAERIAIVDSDAVPEGQIAADEGIGSWETSGIVDVTEFVKTDAEVALLLGVQAHSIEGGTIADQGLVEGGQLTLLNN
ncbi:MAG: alkaline phosphatase PhoX [Ornithinimicrobium sp.]